MDILTHAGIGLIVAMPMLDSHPEFAMGIVAGSVLPDLDALSRTFGQRAFLVWHQTWTHALPVQAIVSLLAGCLAGAFGWNGAELGLGLFAGLAMHSLIDLSNTLGVRLFVPFSRKRLCLEWVFFIDAFVLVCTVGTASILLLQFYKKGATTGGYTAIYLALLGIYFLSKGILRGRAGRLVPEASSLIPSALLPWRFLGTCSSGNSIRLFRINAVNGRSETTGEHHLIDNEYAPVLAAIPEYQLMRELSPEYHVIRAVKVDSGERILCRDLRTRNFETSFGDLEVELDSSGNVMNTRWHV